jgi:molybdopterin/thiamine biosynthesis adenylyltransferase
VIASLQVAETTKVLLGRGKPLSRRVLFANLLDMDFEEIRYG